jgi:hypothetical protein
MNDIVIEEPNPVTRSASDKMYMQTLVRFKLPMLDPEPCLELSTLLNYIGEKKVRSKGYKGNKTISMQSLTSKYNSNTVLGSNTNVWSRNHPTFPDKFTYMTYIV